MLHKLMAYKDEYEVARLFTNGEFRQTLRDRFEGDFTLKFHLAPPLLAKRDPRTGIARKMTFVPGMKNFFTVRPRVRRWRGTWFAVFVYADERKTEWPLSPTSLQPV